MVSMMNQTSVGSVEGVPFTACTSGPDIIILASNFSRVQQITTKANITSIDCSTDVGKIAASYANTIVIFEPIPLQEQNPTGARLDYKWIQTAEIESPTPISVMSFNLEGTRLISGGTTLQLWCMENGCKNSWQCVWRLKTANQITYLKYSPDGTLFCSANKQDRLAKIWYEGTRLGFSFIYISHPQPITGIEWRRTSKYTPRGAVANILITSCQDNISRIWVQTLLPDDGLVNFNQLKTQTQEGEEIPNGTPRVPAQRHRQKLLRRLKRMKAFSQFKKRQSLALDYSIDELEKADNNFNQNCGAISTANIPSAQSAQDFHSYALYTNVLRPGLHFHLAGIIESDHNNEIVHWINNKEIHITRSIELLLHDMLIRILRGNQASSTNSPQSPRDSCSGSENDTENEPEEANDDTITAESSKKLRHKLCSKVNKQRALAASGRKDHESDDTNSQAGNKSLINYANHNHNASGRASPTSLVEEFDKTLESLLKKWQISADLLFSINKSDGSLQLWQVNYLDGEDTGIFRQVQIDKLTTLPSALSHYDATTMSLNVIAYSPSAYLDVKRAYLALTNSSGLNIGNPDQFSPVDVPELLSINTDTSSNTKQPSTIMDADYNASAASLADMEPNIFFVTQHLSGILGLWKMNFNSLYPKVQSIELVTRITGLPIDPVWLKDGTLQVEYQGHIDALLTEWIPDDSTNQTPLLISQLKQSNSPTLLSPINTNQLFQSDFDETKSSLNSTHLPSVDEEIQTSSQEDNQNSNSNNLNDTKTDDNQVNQSDHQSKNNSYTNSKDLFRASELATNINLLPQYHLKQLIELLAFGKLQRVKAILNNLVNCLLTLENGSDKDSDITSRAPWSHRSRTLSIVAQSASSFQDSFDIDNPSSNIQQQVIEEVELDYIEVTSIKPLPLYHLLEADNDKAKSIDIEEKSKREEFSMQDFESFMPMRSQVDQTLDEILGQSTLETLQRQKSLRKKNKAAQKGSLTSFNPTKAKLLTRVLTHTHLPGLSNVDQMHLLAVADAVALFDASANDYDDMQDDDIDSQSQNGAGSVATNIAIDSLDDRGLRFLTAMRQHVYLTRCLPIKQRAELQNSGIGNHNLVWAFHSETQDELVSLIPCVNRSKPEWAELREYGIGWWLKKIEVLRKLMEKVAQSAYQARQDPLDAALFYLAMKKKTLVCALLRRVNCDKRLLKLFEQDFNDPINRKKALKNAYALLGLHRFEHAAAFFILAGCIWDAVEVCINNLNDIQLAIVLIRLHESEANVSSNLRRLLYTEILGSKRPMTSATNTNGDLTNHQASTNGPVNTNQNNNQISPDGNNGLVRNLLDKKGSFDMSCHQQQNARNEAQMYNYNSKHAHQDPFLRSMAFWKLSDYLSAVHTLLESDVGSEHRSRLMSQASSAGQLHNSSSNNSRKNSDAHTNSELFNQTISNRLGVSNNNGNLSISASVFNFYLFLKEQPLVVKHRQQLMEENELRRRASPIEEEEVHSHRARSLSSGEVNFDEQDIKRAVRQSSTEFEVLNETTGRQLEKYSDEAIAKKERVLFFSTALAYLRAGCPILALEVLCREDHLNLSNAQRMKFIACLHILMNELNTLASSSSTRQQHQQQQQPQQSTFRSTNINQGDSISTTSSSGVAGGNNNNNINNSNSNNDGINVNSNKTDPSTSAKEKFRSQFYEWLNRNVNAMKTICSYSGTSGKILDADPGQGPEVLSAPHEDWIRANEPVLRTMLTYCNLHSANENSLTIVRLELLNLLDR